MKKFILFACATLVMALGFSACTDSTPKPWSKEAIEEIAKESARSTYYELTNPTFNSVDEVVLAQDTYIDGKSIDSTFYSMKPSTLKRVADVCINKIGFTDKKGIVGEYLKNVSVYSNMSETIPTQSTKDEKSAATDSGGSDVTKDDGSDGKIFSTEYSYHTDTVDGKPVRIQTKVEKSYVK
jgi:hypothetical protein